MVPFIGDLLGSGQYRNAVASGRSSVCYGTDLAPPQLIIAQHSTDLTEGFAHFSA